MTHDYQGSLLKTSPFPPESFDQRATEMLAEIIDVGYPPLPRVWRIILRLLRFDTYQKGEYSRPKSVSQNAINVLFKSMFGEGSKEYWLEHQCCGCTETTLQIKKHSHKTLIP